MNPCKNVPMQRNVSANHDGVMQHFFAKRPSSGFSLEVLSVDSVVAIRMLTSKDIFENYKNINGPLKIQNINF